MDVDDDSRIYVAGYGSAGSYCFSSALFVLDESTDLLSCHSDNGSWQDIDARDDGSSALATDWPGKRIVRWTPPAPYPRNLRVDVTGPGWVTSSPPGIDCPDACETQTALHDVVTLTADSESGIELAGWFGDCSGTSECVLDMNTDKRVGAKFEPTFDVDVVGPGAVMVDVVGDPLFLPYCTASCHYRYPAGTNIIVSPFTLTGGRFDHFEGGDCDPAHTTICSVVLSRGEHVSAVFVPTTTTGGGNPLSGGSTNGAGGGGTAPPAPVTAAVPAATPSAACSLTLARARLRKALQRGLATSVRCTRAGRAIAILFVSRPLARRLHLRSTTVAGGEGRLSAGRQAILTLRFSREAARKLRRLRSLKLTARLAGPGANVRATLVLRR
jgi:hypothetical protein